MSTCMCVHSFNNKPSIHVHVRKYANTYMNVHVQIYISAYPLPCNKISRVHGFCQNKLLAEICDEILRCGDILRKYSIQGLHLLYCMHTYCGIRLLTITVLPFMVFVYSACSIFITHPHYTGIFSPIKDFTCKFFAQSNFRRQTLGLVQVNVRYTKYFVCFSSEKVVDKKF